LRLHPRTGAGGSIESSHPRRPRGGAGLLRLARPALAGLLRPRAGAELVRLARAAPAPSLLDPPSCQSSPRRGARQSRSQILRTTTSRFASPLAVGTKPRWLTLQSSTFKRECHSQRDGCKGPLSRIKRVTLCLVPDTPQSFGEGEAGWDHLRRSYGAKYLSAIRGEVPIFECYLEVKRTWIWRGRYFWTTDYTPRSARRLSHSARPPDESRLSPCQALGSSLQHRCLNITSTANSHVPGWRARVVTGAMSRMKL
jgi:hypothetical protein